MDKLVIGTAANGNVRVLGAITTDLVNEAVKIHGCSQTAGAAFGRMLTAGALFGAMLKNEKDAVTLQINGGGPIKGVTVTSYAGAKVKGYVNNPTVELPLNPKGKLSVGEAVGKDGTFTVIRDLGLKEPYVGQSPIYSGEIGEDIAYYFTVSEQTPSAVGLGVLVNPDLSIKASGGFIIQMLPGADELVADLLTYRLEEIPPISELISDNKSIEEILEYIFEGMDFKIGEEMTPSYTCDCTEEKVERVFLSIGEKDLKEIYEDGKTEELQCHFCGKKYAFTNDKIGELLKSLEKNK